MNKHTFATTPILALIWLMSFCPISSADESISSELSQAIALKPDIENGKKIYRLCASCHLENGWGKPNGSFPVIAGQHRDVLIKQLEDIRSKNRNNPTMYPFTEPGTIGGLQGIADVTAYIAAMPADPNPGVGSGKELALGKQVYQLHCVQCHGGDGLGNNKNFFPKLKGQHYAYLLRQLKWIGNGYRKNTNPEMVKRVKDLSASELDAVADYLSRLKG